MNVDDVANNTLGKLPSLSDRANNESGAITQNENDISTGNKEKSEINKEQNKLCNKNTAISSQDNNTTLPNVVPTTTAFGSAPLTPALLPLPLKARSSSSFSSPTMNLLRSMFTQSLTSITRVQQQVHSLTNITQEQKVQQEQNSEQHSHKKRRLSADNTANFSNTSSFQQSKQQQQQSISSCAILNDEKKTESVDESSCKVFTMSTRGRGGARNRGRLCTTNDSDDKTDDKTKITLFEKINIRNKELLQNELQFPQEPEHAQQIKTNILSQSTQNQHILMLFASNKFRECFLCANLKNTRKSVKHACYQCVLPFCVSCFNLYHYTDIFLDSERDKFCHSRIRDLKRRKERSTIDLASKRIKLDFDYSLYSGSTSEEGGNEDKEDDKEKE